MRRFVLVLFGAAAFLGSVSTAAVAGPSDTSGGAQACQQGGFLSLVGTNGGFANVGECVSYAARGGRFLTVPSGAFLLAAGQTATLSETLLVACNSLTYGYQVAGGDVTALGSKPAGCFGMAQPDSTIGPFATAVIFSVVLVDDTCSITFDSTGDHAAVTGTNPYTIAIDDAGLGCDLTGPRPPPPGGGNLRTTLTIG